MNYKDFTNINNKKNIIIEVSVIFLIVVLTVVVICAIINIRDENDKKANAQFISSDYGKVIKPESDELTPLKNIIAKNSDARAWLIVPGTKINDAVVQAADNEYYLRRNEMKKEHYYGCYFFDYENKIGNRSKLSKNTIIFGHNINDNPNGEKFAQLLKYKDVDFVKKNPYIYLIAPDDKMTFIVFAAFYTDTNLAYNLPSPSDKMFMKVTDEAIRRSEFFGSGVGVSDKILTLSTCTYKYGKRKDQRFVVMAKLLRSGDKGQVEFTKNPSPKAPQFK